MLLEINMGLKKMKRKANALAKHILGFFEPQIFENCSGNLTQSRVLFSSPMMTNNTHKTGKIQHISLVCHFQKDTDQQKDFQRTFLKMLRK